MKETGQISAKTREPHVVALVLRPGNCDPAVRIADSAPFLSAEVAIENGWVSALDDLRKRTLLTC